MSQSAGPFDALFYMPFFDRSHALFCMPFLHALFYMPFFDRSLACVGGRRVDAIVYHRWLSLTNTHWVMGQSAAPTDEVQPPNRGALASNTHKHTRTHTRMRAPYC